MKLYEYQGRRIFQESGIRIPKGILLLPSDEQDKIEAPAILKAQVMVGGRGKAGGIKFCNEKKDIPTALKDLFSMEIKGEQVRAVLAIQEKFEILREFYMSITFKASDSTPVLVFCADGGVEIEKVAQNNPEKIITLTIDPFIGPTEYQARYISKVAEYKDVAGMKKLIDSLFKAFVTSDATLVEINPLADTPDGLVALDAKVTLDEKAKYRQENLFEKLTKENNIISGQKDDGREDTITYVPLSGYVGHISDGAGTGMLALDLIHDAGGEAANFCEMGGITNPDVMYSAMSEVLNNPNVKSLLIVLIGGFNRMDEMAEGIIRYKEEHGINVPVAIRMCGTMEDVGMEMMNKAGIPTYQDLMEAVNSVVLTSGGK